MEEIAPGITKEWLHDGKIVCYTVRNVSQQAVDAWAETAKATLRNWPPGQPYLALYDISDKNVAFTPYLRQRASEIGDVYPEVAGRYAVILPRSIAAHLFRLFVQVDLSRQKARRIRRVFLNKEDAIAWLLEALN